MCGVLDEYDVIHLYGVVDVHGVVGVHVGVDLYGVIDLYDVIDVHGVADFRPGTHLPSVWPIFCSESAGGILFLFYSFFFFLFILYSLDRNRALSVARCVSAFCLRDGIKLLARRDARQPLKTFTFVISKGPRPSEEAHRLLLLFILQ